MRFFALETVPAASSTWPGEPTPTPASSRGSAPACSAASRSAPAIVAATRAGRRAAASGPAPARAPRWRRRRPRPGPSSRRGRSHRAASWREATRAGCARHMACCAAPCAAPPSCPPWSSARRRRRRRACGASTPAPTRRAPRPGPGRGVRLATVGRFEQPVYVTAPAGDRRRLFVVEQTGRIRVVRGGRKLRAAVPRHPRAGHAPAASRACCRWPSRRTTRARALLRLLHGPRRRGQPRRRVPPRASADRADPARARRRRPVDGRPRAQPQRRPAAVRPRRPPLRRHRRRRRRRRPARRARQRPGPRVAARQDPAHRPARGAAARPYTVPAVEPVRRRARARGEIYAYGLRNPWRFSFDRETGDLVDRRRRPGRRRGDRLRPPRRARAARTSAGGRVEGRAALHVGEPAPGAVGPVITARPRATAAARSPAATSCATRRCPGSPAATSTATSARAAAAARGCAAGRARRRGAPRAAGRRSSSSFGEDARGRVYAVSLDGPVYRLVRR